MDILLYIVHDRMCHIYDFFTKTCITDLTPFYLNSKMVFQFAYPFEKITFSSIFKSMPWSMLSVMILSFLTDRSGQTVMTKFKLLLEMQPDQCLHCLLFHLHLLEALLHSKASKFVFSVNSNVIGHPNIRL